MKNGDIDDVPPLEDMSEVLRQATQLQQRRQRKQDAPQTKKPFQAKTGSQSQTQIQSQGQTTVSSKPTQEKTTEAMSVAQQPQLKKETRSSHQEQERVSKEASFGGLKKGFLFGSSSSASGRQRQRQRVEKKTVLSPTAADTSDIPLIKPQGDGAHNGAQRIPEVQEALKAASPFLQNKDWITDDLLGRIEKHPRLARQMANPRFSQAIGMFQTNPQGALQYFQENPDIQEFFQDFCGIMGDHFTSMGASQTPPTTAAPIQEVKVHDPSLGGADLSVASSTDPKQPTAADEARMRDIMADPAVVKAFSDPRTRVLFETLRTNPDRAQKMMQDADADFKSHIQILVSKGLLGFAR